MTLAKQPVRRPVKQVVAVTAAALSVLALAGCGDDNDPVRPQTVKLSARGVDSTMRIGMVVSLKAAPGQGSEWTAAASGAEVATYRYRLGGTTVELDVVDDQGTADGASAAVQQLVGDDVSGIVMATSGSHLDGVLADDETSASTPILMPYAAGSLDSADDLPANVWLTGPSADQVSGTTKDFVSAQGWNSPVLVRVAGDTTDPISAVALAEVAKDGSTTAAVKAVRAADKKGADVVVVDGPAATAADVVAALQKTKVDLPVVIGGREALSPAFADDLSDAGGSLAGQLFAIGTDTGDVSALGTGSDSRRVATYFAALRSAADSSLKGLFGQGRFRSDAGSADVASHDAVVALVGAADEAGSTEPAKVLRALAKARFTSSDGLAGPSLDFTGHAAVPDASVEPLVATDQDPGVRPAGTDRGDALFWFAVPPSGTA